ncbi:MAG: hypothetical protein ACRDNZ_22775 [Streptosporangiaceae bacterium]
MTEAVKLLEDLLGNIGQEWIAAMVMCVVHASDTPETAVRVGGREHRGRDAEPVPARYQPG